VANLWGSLNTLPSRWLNIPWTHYSKSFIWVFLCQAQESHFCSKFFIWDAVGESQTHYVIFLLFLTGVENWRMFRRNWQNLNKHRKLTELQTPYPVVTEMESGWKFPIPSVRSNKIHPSLSKPSQPWTGKASHGVNGLVWNWGWIWILGSGSPRDNYPHTIAKWRCDQRCPAGYFSQTRNFFSNFFSHQVVFKYMGWCRERGKGEVQI